MGFRKDFMKKNKILRKIANWHKLTPNDKYLSRHTEIERFNFPKTFYFKYCPCSLELHWAIIKEVDNKFKIYFINNWGRVFDELEFKKKKIAQRQLRKNGFDFSTNRFCPFIPPEPIYIKLSKGKKSAPYSKGNLWKKVQRNKKHFDKLEKNYLKNIIKLRKIKLKKQEYKLLTISKKQNNCIKKEIIHNKKNSAQGAILTKNKENNISRFALAVLFLIIVLILNYSRNKQIDVKQPLKIEYKQEQIDFKRIK